MTKYLLVLFSVLVLACRSQASLPAVISQTNTPPSSATPAPWRAIGNVNLRTAPYEDGGNVLAVIGTGEAVRMIEDGGKWCFVEYRDLQGYALCKWLKQ